MSTFMPSTETVFQKTSENTMIVNMGPQHPSTHGVLRVICELEAETIVQCKVQIGYLHTGMEKEAEYQQYQKCVVMTDRMDYLNANGNNLAHPLAVEKLLAPQKSVCIGNSLIISAPPDNVMLEYKYDAELGRSLFICAIAVPNLGVVNEPIQLLVEPHFTAARAVTRNENLEQVAPAKF